jgi:hypothetical protein
LDLRIETISAGADPSLPDFGFHSKQRVGIFAQGVRFYVLEGMKRNKNPSYFFTQIESAKCFWSNSSAPTIVDIG